MHLWFLRRQTAVEWGVWVALAMCWSFLLAYGAIAWRLSRRPPLPLSRLRAVEIILFGLLVLDLIVDRLMSSWLRPGLGHLLELYEIGPDYVAGESLGCLP